METIMEPDELKHIWQAMGRQLERQEAINLQLFRERKLARARGSLRPLFWGQVVQILFGCLFLLLATLFWSVGPHPAHVVLAGIVVHAYGIGTIIVAGMTLGAIRRIDYAAPVVAIQKQLASLRRLYLVNGMVAGLPWWFLWVPGLLVLAALGGLAIAPALEAVAPYFDQPTLKEEAALAAVNIAGRMLKPLPPPAVAVLEKAAAATANADLAARARALAGR